MLDTHPDTEPSGTHVRDVGGTNVVFQYGAVLPGFDGWRTHEPTREYLSLDKRWRFRFDPRHRGLDQGWESPHLDDSAWGLIDVPAAWDLLDTPGFATETATFGTGTAFTDGYAWYRTTVDVPGSWRARHVRLAFLAAGYSAEVWLDGTHLGKHEGANSPFALPVAGASGQGRDRRSRCGSSAGRATPITRTRLHNRSPTTTKSRTSRSTTGPTRA